MAGNKKQLKNFFMASFMTTSMLLFKMNKQLDKKLIIG